jgi:Transcriptional regulator PadR-like family
MKHKYLANDRFSQQNTKCLDVIWHYHHNVVLIMLGEFEYLLITAAATLGDDAYGAAIRAEIESTTRHRCSIGALYTTIDRLEKKGLSRPGWVKRPRSALQAHGARDAERCPRGQRVLQRGRPHQSACILGNALRKSHMGATG